MLGPKTVELMTSNHIGTLYLERQLRLRPRLRDHRARRTIGPPGSVGEFGWGGAYFTSYWVDPQEKLVVVFMSQLLPSGDLDLQAKLRTLVYQSIEVLGRDLAPVAPARRAASSR